MAKGISAKIMAKAKAGEKKMAGAAVAALAKHKNPKMAKSKEREIKNE